MNGNRKGSSFERYICKRLSVWWSADTEVKARDDLFWRACQSGGRATQRAKTGKKTFGSYGDIAAVDPVGLPFLKVFTCELKRGRSHGDIGDMIDIARGAAPRPFEKTLEQTITSQNMAGSLSWLLFSQRDRRRCMVFGDWDFFQSYFPGRIPLIPLRRTRQRITFFALEGFLRRITPTEIIKLAKSL